MWSLPFHTPAAAAALLSLCGLATAQQKGEWFSELQPCPQSCSASGINSGNWTLYHDAVKLYSCKEPMLLDMSLHTPVDDPSKTLSLFACWGNNNDGDASCNEATADANVTTTSDTSETATVEVIWSGTGQSQRADDAVAVAQYASSQTSPLSCELDDRTSTFAYLNGVFIGVWTGPMVDKQTTVNLLDQVVSGLKNEVQGNLQLSQVCGSNRTSDYTVGVAVAIPDSVADLAALAQVQNAVKTWSMGNCVAADPGSSKTSKSTLEVHQLALTSPSTRRDLDTRADCRTIVVVSRDSCGSLAKKCGISGANFTKYNPKKNLCSTLAVKQHVCCSSDTLPSYAPKPQSDGVCATYLVKKGDTCADLAAFYTVTVTQIENWNKKTWGWMGCKDLQAKMKICLSSGDALMPAPIANAKCGPQVPGTKRPTNGTALALLNQCPLKACCDKWGQCGITSNFCTQIDSATGAPGTSKNGTNGCISNCGTKLISSSAPAHFRSVAYFEAFNSGRKCLNMDVRSLQGFNYDTIHFAFANVSTKFDVDVSSLQKPFEDFVAMKNNGFQRVLSFGGWSFSTDADSYPIFRESVTDANRATFASNVVAFVKKWDLDGVDFDWEYPGAPDIPNIPPGNPGDGGRYLSFLKTLKSKLPAGTTLSIAAPASFWYLKGFPIADISKVVDYIIYMTYDLHGQWDWNNTWSDRPGCPHGGCLRSHVNLTETMEALTMITKAGVASNKVIVGTASYGRSFKMSEKSCTGPSCHFTGPKSGATPGRCTKTAGYISNAEIFELLEAGSGSTHYDKGSDSNVAIYGDNWVSYMTLNTTSGRQAKYKGLNFGGTTNWAVDLQSWMLPFDPVNVLASNVDWEKVPAKSLCNDINRSASGWWDDAGCDSAWKAAIKYWNSVSPANQKLHGFSAEIANFFNSSKNSINMQCNSLNVDNGCSADAGPSCGDPVSPAGYLILTSFTHINSQLYQMYVAIEEANDDVSPSVSSMSQVFNPPPSGSDALSLIEEFLQPVFAMAMGPEFEKVLDPLEIGPLPETNHEPPSGQKVKDATKSAIGNITSQLIDDGWDYIQDNIGTTSSWTDPTATLQQNLKNLTNYWLLGLQGMGNSTFSGSARAVSNLYSMIDHGSFLFKPVTPEFTLSQAFQTPIYARLIPAAWSNNAGEGNTIGPQGLFVLDSGDSCSSGSSCSSSVPSHLSAFLTGDTAKNACFCDGGKMYYLALLKGGAQNCVAFPVEQCTNQTFSTPPGLDALDGKAWGGLTLKKFIAGAVNTYKANGNKNGFKPSYNNPSIMASYISGDVTAPGGVAIPVCSAQEAFDNWYAESTTRKNFPCN
ncbi:hypothetical protein ACHAO4_000666 [Trichoderma viride]